MEDMPSPCYKSSAGNYTYLTNPFLSYDEGYEPYPSNYVYSVWAGPAVKTHYASSTQSSHYSLPSTIEAAWGLQPLTTRIEDHPMTELFLPSPGPPPMLTVSLAFSRQSRHGLRSQLHRFRNRRHTTPQ